MLLSEWIKINWGIIIPDFTLLNGGVPDVFAHLLLYFILAFVITEVIFKTHDNIRGNN